MGKLRRVENVPFTTTCLACKDLDGHVYCEGNKHGRAVFSANGLGDQAKMILGFTIAQCLEGTQFEPTPDSLDEVRALAELDLTEEEDELSKSAQAPTSLTWGIALSRFVLRNTPVDSEKPPKPLSPGEKRGVASEEIITTTLSNYLLFPWITAVALQERNSEADCEGIDIIITLDKPVSSWLQTTELHIQVKSDPETFIAFLNKKRKSDGSRNLTAQEYMFRRKFVLLNGGGGEVSLQGVVGPFICQLYQLIEVESGTERATQFLNYVETNTPEAYALVVRAVTQDIIGRDYGKVITTEIAV